MTTAPLDSIVILGASGFIGGRIAHCLEAAGVRRVIRYSSSECNLLDRAEVDAKLECCDEGTSIVFCAAVSRTAEDSWEALQRNIAMVYHFVAALRDRQIRSVIFLSSADVYGMPPGEVPIREDTPPRPSSHYGVSKLSGEAILMVGKYRSWPCTVLRLPGAYGDGDRGRSVVGRIAEQLANGETIRITGDGSTQRDYVEVSDVCRLVHSLLKRPRTDVVNVATGASLSVGRMVELTAEALEVAPVVKHEATSSERDHDLIFDTSRLRSLCPDITFTPLEQGIRDYVSRIRSGRAL